MKKKRIIGLILIAVAIAGWFLFGSGKEGETTVLATATVNKGQVRKQLEATGIVKAQVGAYVKIGAQATGRINRMHVKVGDKVTQGDLIAEIDDRELVAAETEAQARLERMRSELSRVEKVMPLRIREAEANLEAARAEFDYAQQNHLRQQELYDKSLIAKDTLDDALQKSIFKRSAMESNQATLARLKAEYVKDLQTAKKNVIEARASLNVAQTRLSHTKIISPLTGVVSLVAAQEGETVVSGLSVSNLITVLDPKRLEMWIYVDETDIGQVVPGMTVDFQVDAYPETVFSDTIDQIYPEPEIRDNIVYYQALVRLDPDEASTLRPEMTTHCKIVVEIKDDVLALPNAALKWVDGKQVVFLTNADKGGVSPVHPELGLEGVGFSEVLSGLAQGDVVATKLVLPGQKTKQKGKK